MREATAFWDREVVQPQHSSWLHEWWLREYANTLIGGDMPLWPMDWFQRWLEGRTFERALTIGCGTGALERDLVRRNLVQRIEAFDASIASLAIASRQAREEGLQRIHRKRCDRARSSRCCKSDSTWRHVAHTAVISSA
jgi:2-polyprenyl-3-methyl-5-hydroxy-6-metoxy-1,4-benzoquinol methylase